MSAAAQRASFPAMSTTVELIGVGIDGPEMARAAALGRCLAEEWEARFSRFRPESQLSRLNAAGGCATRVDATFLDLLETARDAVWRTGGLFDPSVLPALVALGYDRDIDQVRREPGRIDPRPPLAFGPDGWARVEIDRRRGEIRLPPGMRIDLGGIAKGAFVDRLAVNLASWPGGAVDAGGDLRVWGESPDGARWTIGIEDPRRPGNDALVAEIVAADGIGVATSGTHRRRWQAAGRVVHHLIDPRSGLPAGNTVRSVTVFARDVTTAEIAAKPLLIVAGGAATLETYGATVAVVIDGDGRVAIAHGESSDVSSISLSRPVRRSA
jgi:thiamine biosynthesis lipoprotein